MRLLAPSGGFVAPAGMVVNTCDPSPLRLIGRPRLMPKGKVVGHQPVILCGPYPTTT